MKLGYYNLFALFILLASCSKKTNFEHDLRQVLQHEAVIKEELVAMKDSIGREWDEINSLLVKHLSPDMPSEEKNNMLKVRNANLIRMFESFDSLPDEAKQALAKVEKKDQEMSIRINLKKKQAQAIEDQKIKLLEAIRKELGEQALQELMANQMTVTKANNN